jgi:hypothetical protein
MSAIQKGAIVAAMLAGSALVGAVSAASQSSTVTFKPLHGVSVHIGSKHAVGYFQTDAGVCQLTLVVGEEPKAEEVVAQTPARFRTAIEAGQHARFDTGEGKELEFHCAPGATAMSVETMQQTAYTAVSR